MVKGNILYSTAISPTGEIVNAIDAEKEINYSCLLCKQHLILRKGKKKRPHFAHKNLSPNCTPETALHYSFKSLLANKIQEHLDKNEPLKMKWHCTECDYYHSGDLIRVAKKVKTEYDLGSCRPDIALLNENDRVVAVIEVIVTHSPEQQALEFYRENNIAVVTFTLKSDKDTLRLNDPILESDSLNLCTNPKCPDCHKRMAKRTLLIVDAECGNCKAPMKLAALENSHYGIGGFNQLELEIATKKGCYLKSRYIRGTRYEYFVNTCRSCNSSIDTVPDLMYEINSNIDSNSQEFYTDYCPYCSDQ